MGVLLQTRVRGRGFDGRRNTRAFLELAKAAGATAAALHEVRIRFGPERGLEHLLGRLEGGLPELALTAPPLYATLRRLLDQIRNRAEHGVPDDLVASHGDLKYDQLLRYRHRSILIDLEMFCRAEPWYDVGHFCAYLPTS